MIEIEWNNISLELLPERAMVWRRHNLLLIADPHFGKAATFRTVGIPIPEQTSQDDLERLNSLIERTQSRRIVILGDFLHSRSGRTQTVYQALKKWRSSLAQCQIDLVMGNHDEQAGAPWKSLDIRIHRTSLKIDHISLVHHCQGLQGPEIGGHLHPSYRLKARASKGFKLPCFWVQRRTIVLPAFGRFTGTHNIQKGRNDRLFLTDDTEIRELQGKDRS